MVVYAVGVEMTPEQVAEMVQEIDPNGTGDVDFDEFVQAFRTQLDQSPRDILGNSHFGKMATTENRAAGRSALVIEEDERRAASYDEDGLARWVGDLPFQLIAIMKNHTARVMEVFNTLDEDGDGQIVMPEFVRIIKQLGIADAASEKDLERLFKGIDSNDNGVITFIELQDACSKARRGQSVLTMTEEEEMQRELARSELERARAEEEDRLARERAAAAEAEEEARRQLELAALEAAKEAERRRIEERRRLRAEQERLRAEAEAARVARELEKLRELAKAMQKMQQQMLESQSHRKAPRMERPLWKAYLSPPDGAKLSVYLRTKADSCTEHAMLDQTLARWRNERQRRGQAWATGDGSAPVPASLNPTLLDERSRTRRIAPDGLRLHLLSVSRMAPHHYVFATWANLASGPSASAATVELNPGPGFIRDDTLVEAALSALQRAYPRDVPRETAYADYSGAGGTCRRRVRTMLSCNGSVLDVAKPIGEQCRVRCFVNVASPRLHTRSPRPPAHTPPVEEKPGQPLHRPAPPPGRASVPAAPPHRAPPGAPRRNQQRPVSAR